MVRASQRLLSRLVRGYGRRRPLAVAALEDKIVQRAIGAVLNAAWLIRFVQHRINDPRMIRLIQKWLKAGILKDGVVATSDTGTGQGSVASSLLSNVYLHYVFDLWAERWRRSGVGRHDHLR